MIRIYIKIDKPKGLKSSILLCFRGESTSETYSELIKMIKITRKAIDSTLEKTIKAYNRGELQEFQMSVEERVKQEKPLLYDYINSGIEGLQKIDGEEGQLILAGYRSASHLTFRMIEEQLDLNPQQSPEITIEDIEKANEGVEILTRMEVSDISLAKIAQIRNENPKFGDYVTIYIMHQAPNEMIARGFALGVITTYTAYEQAFERLKTG